MPDPLGRPWPSECLTGVVMPVGRPKRLLIVDRTDIETRVWPEFGTADLVPPKCCAKGKCCDSTPSASTVRYLLRLLRAALQDAVDEDLISRNVAKLVKLRLDGDRRVEPFSTSEARRFLAATSEHRLHALWAVALGLGLRRGEALGLKWADIDLERKRVTVRRSLQRVAGELRLEATKTDRSTRTIPLPSPLVDVLERHRKQQLEEKFQAGSEWVDHGLVFTTKHGGPTDPRNVNQLGGLFAVDDESDP